MAKSFTNLEMVNNLVFMLKKLLLVFINKNSFSRCKCMIFA